MLVERRKLNRLAHAAEAFYKMDLGSDLRSSGPFTSNLKTLLCSLVHHNFHTAVPSAHSLQSLLGHQAMSASAVTPATLAQPGAAVALAPAAPAGMAPQPSDETQTTGDSAVVGRANELAAGDTTAQPRMLLLQVVTAPAAHLPATATVATAGGPEAARGAAASNPAGATST